MASSSPQVQRTQTICLLILTGLAIAGALYYFRPVIVPFVLAIFLTYCLTPVIDVQMRWLRFPRVVAIASTIVLGCILLGLLGVLVGSAVSQLGERAGDYQARTEQLLRDVTKVLPLERFGLDTNDEELSKSLYAAPAKAAADLLAGTVSGLMGVLTNGALVLIFMVFLLMGKGSSAGHVGGVLSEIEAGTKRYISMMVLISGVLGLLVGVTLAVLGVQFALMFGFLAFLLNFIPNLGPVIATLLPAPIVLLDPEFSLTGKILVIAIPGLWQFVIGNYFQPKLTGQSLDLHPVSVLLALILFGLLWGIVGMFLATPITAVLRILFDKLEYTKPLAGLLAGRLPSSTAGETPAAT
ncbi:MAG: AI-2E family transporter [Planctomycetota bacterium]